jgi:hypothetical protein
LASRAAAPQVRAVAWKCSFLPWKQYSSYRTCKYRTGNHYMAGSEVPLRKGGLRSAHSFALPVLVQARPGAGRAGSHGYVLSTDAFKTAPLFSFHTAGLGVFAIVRKRSRLSLRRSRCDWKQATCRRIDSSWMRRDQMVTLLDSAKTLSHSAASFCNSGGAFGMSGLCLRYRAMAQLLNCRNTSWRWLIPKLYPIC